MKIFFVGLLSQCVGAPAASAQAAWVRRGLSATELSIPSEESMFPVVLANETADTLLTFDEVVHSIEANRAALRKELDTHGALLFRGYDVNEPTDFERILRALGLALKNVYRPADARRSMVSEYVFTSADSPGYHIIPPHHEQTYSTFRPGVIAFFAKRPPTDTHGETPLFRTASILNELPSDIAEKLLIKGVEHKRLYSNKPSSSEAPEPATSWKSWFKSMRGAVINFAVEHLRLPLPPTSAHQPPWQEVFQTWNKSEVLEFTAKLGLDISWSEQTGDASYAAKVPNVVLHPRTGEPRLVWQAHQWSDSALRLNQKLLEERLPDSKKLSSLPWSFREGLARLLSQILGINYIIPFSDGSDVSHDIIEKLTHSLWKHSVFFKWQKGDVLVIDNVNAMHMRMISNDPQRKILAALSDFYSTVDHTASTASNSAGSASCSQTV